jgi:CRP/FNR family transcriptional regulator, cyclic AMP receptor protein
VTDLLADDVARIAASRPTRPLGTAEALLDAGEARRSLHLLLEGGLRLDAETPFGPHPLGQLPAPVLFDVRAALGGGEGVCRGVPLPGTRAARVPVEEARRLLFAPGPDGAALRRLALGSLTTALRTAIASLAGFFDPPVGAVAAAEEPVNPPPVEERPVDPEHAGALFDAAGLDPTLLPALGLTARRLLPGATLFAEGAAGGEAAIVAEGRLRVSVLIPGAGEEALAILGPGEIVGEMSLVDEAPRSASVYAHNGPATVYVLSREVFRGLLESGDDQGAPLLAGIAIVLSRRLEEALRKAAGFRILSGPG